MAIINKAKGGKSSKDSNFFKNSSPPKHGCALGIIPIDSNIWEAEIEIEGQRFKLFWNTEESQLEVTKV